MNVERVWISPADDSFASRTSIGVRKSFAPPGVALGFRGGEQIYDQDDRADRIYRVIRGAVLGARLLPDGRRQVGGFFFEGDLFGIEAGATRHYAAEALGGGCKVAVIWPCPSTVDTEVLVRLVSEATRQELGRAREHTSILSRTTACEKVATFLLNLANRFDPVRVHLPMSRQDMADYLGITIETISRTLGSLQRDGVVEFRGSREYRVTQPGALKRLALT